MRKKIGNLMQAAGGLLLFALACASDMGTVPVAALPSGLACAALVFFAGRLLSRRRKKAVRCHLAVVVPLHKGAEAPSGIRS